MDKKKADNRIWQLDYLKAFCAISVIITHNWLAGYNKFSIVFPFLINMAVPVFLIIHGYLNTKSFEKMHMKTSTWFSLKQIGHKMSGVLGPYIVIYVIEVIGLKFIAQKEWLSGTKILHNFFSGGLGPGGYFIPVIVQAVIFFPILAKAVWKHPIVGSFGILGIQLVFELLFAKGFFSADIYRLSYFRYLFFSVGGILLCKYQDSKRIRWKNVFVLFSIGYIMLVNYTDVEIAWFGGWKRAALPVVFWAIFITNFALTHFKILPPDLHQVISLIGASSFSVFLVQKLYYLFNFGKLFDFIAINVVVNIVICVTLGCLYESAVRKGITILKVWIGKLK